MKLHRAQLLPGIILCSSLMLLCHPSGSAQTKKGSASAVRPVAPKKKQITVLLGAGIPLSREGLTQFWKVGPSGSMTLFVNVNSSTALGLGIDLARLYFRLGAFSTTFPGVLPVRKDIAMGHVYVGVKHSFAPTRWFSPYIAGTIGAARVTGAVYREVIDSVRVTYYDLPGRTRLAGSLALGTDIRLGRTLSFTMEAKATYFHNDPDVGFFCLIDGGFRVTL